MLVYPRSRDKNKQNARINDCICDYIWDCIITIDCIRAGATRQGKGRSGKNNISF